MTENDFWCNLDPNRVWRAPTPKLNEVQMQNEHIKENIKNKEKKNDLSSMMRLTQNTSCISLSALEQQPSGSSATIFPPASRPRRTAPLEEQLLANLQNVSIFNSNDIDMASLGITAVSYGNGNPWQPKSASFGTASTNGFTGSDTSSAPMSPISSPGLRKFQTSRSMVKNPAHPHHMRNTRGNGQHHHNSSSSSNQQFHGNHRQSNTQSQPRTVQMKGNGEEHNAGMRDLPYWLKKLRLHKYAPLFQDLTYRQLLAIDNDELERMKVTNGARKKIAQSIEKLHERPALLKAMDQKLKNGSQCVRCAICTVRQLLWSPFIKYEGGSRKSSAEIIDGFNVPTHMISDENLPALMFRVIETLNFMVFPLRKQLIDLEDEYQLTMFHMFESVMKNDSFTQNQQRRAFAMKRNARNYANPEEIRRHRMGMVSSSQCEGCHHAEVVNRERLMEFQDRQVRQARGSPVGQPSLSSCSAFLDLSLPPQQARLEFNVPPASPSQRIQKRPAAQVEDEEWLTGSPKITAPISSSPISDVTILESIMMPHLQTNHFWKNVTEIWGDEKPTTPYKFPEYRKPAEYEETSSPGTVVFQTSDEFNQPSFQFMRLFPEQEPSKTPSLSDFAFPESVTSSSKKANSTGSGYSSSDSEISIITSPRASTVSMEDHLVYGVNQILCPPPYNFL